MDRLKIKSLSFVGANGMNVGLQGLRVVGSGTSEQSAHDGMVVSGALHSEGFAHDRAFATVGLEA